MQDGTESPEQHPETQHWKAEGDRLLGEGHLEAACSAYVHMFRAAEAQGQAPASQAAGYRALANVLRDNGYFRPALELYQDALARSRSGADGLDLALTLNEYGKALRRIGQLEEALAFYTEGIAIAAETDGGERLENWIRGNRGMVYQELNRLEEARQDLETVLHQDLARDPHSVDTARSYHNLADLYECLGRKAEALRAYHRARRIDSRLDPNSASVAITLNNIAQLLLNAAKPERGLRYSLRAEELLVGDAAHLQDLIIVRNNLGTLYLYQGRSAEAIAVYRELIPLALAAESDPRRISIYLCNLGRALQDLADYSGAEQHYREALACLEGIPEYSGYGATCLNNLAATLIDQGRATEAVPLLREAYAADASRQDLYGMARDAANLSAALKQCGEWWPALREIRTAIRLMRRVNPNSRELASYFNSLGGFFYERGRLRYAIWHYRRALELLDHTAPASLLVVRVLNNLGFAYLGRKYVTPAYLTFLSALQRQRRLYQSLSTERDRQSYLADRASPYTGAMAALWMLGEPKHQLRALQLTEEFRAQNLLTLLERRERLLAPGEGSAVQDLVRRMNRRRYEIEQLRRELTASPTGRLEKITTLAEAEQDLARLERAEREHRQAQAISSVASDSDALGGELAENELLLVYFMEGEEAYGWAVRSHSCEMFRAAGPDEDSTSVVMLKAALETLAERARCQELLYQQVEPEARAALRERMDQLWSWNRDGSARGLETEARQVLAGCLLQPISEDAWKGVEHVWIVPHRELFSLAFETLSLADGRLLGEVFTTAYLPSCAVKERLETRQETRPEAESPLLVLMNPSFQDPRFLDLGMLPALPETMQAAQWRVEIRDGKAAHKAALAELGSQAQILHLNTHAELHPEAPLEGILALAAAEPVPARTEHLSVHEIFDLDLSADLVTLSACRTVAGRLQPGEGLVGFSQAFFAAGAQCLVLTLWSVNPGVTSFLFTQFYAALARGTTIAAALREARMALRTQNPDPSLWASVVAVGRANRAVC